MHGSALAPRFLLLLAAAALFIWLTSNGLPPLVATHFGAGGEADGFMTHSAYVAFMIAFVVLLPLLLNLALDWALHRPGARISLPDCEYWLSAERREASVAFLLQHMRCFGIGLAAFLCVTHWLVVQANRRWPPRLDTTGMDVALGLFLLALVTWIVLLRRRFRRPPR